MFRCWTVLEGGEVEDETVFTFRSLLFAVEALSCFVSEPFALQHLLQERGKLDVGALVFGVGGEVAHDAAEDVEAHHISEAEGSGFRPAHRLASQDVDFFDGETELLHYANRVEHGECADAVRDEVGPVLGRDDGFAEVDFGESGDGYDGGRIAGGSCDDFNQLHVARRIEEVCAEEAGAHILRQGLRDVGDGQAAGVGREDCVGAEIRHGAGQEVVLDLEVFGDGLDDPVAVFEFVEVGVEIADDDAGREVRRGEGGGFGFLQGFESLSGESVGLAGLWYVEEKDREAGVRHVRRDARAHRAGAEHGDATDGPGHGV